HAEHVEHPPHVEPFSESSSISGRGVPHGSTHGGPRQLEADGTHAGDPWSWDPFGGFRLGAKRGNAPLALAYASRARPLGNEGPEPGDPASWDPRLERLRAGKQRCA